MLFGVGGAAVVDEEDAAEDGDGGEEFLPGEGVHSDIDADDDGDDRLDIGVHTHQCWPDVFLCYRDQKVCDECRTQYQKE